jgi:hypothetical protein
VNQRGGVEVFDLFLELVVGKLWRRDFDVAWISNVVKPRAGRADVCVPAQSQCRKRDWQGWKAAFETVIPIRPGCGAFWMRYAE